MSTTCIEFSEKESSAIKEYAMMCRESVSKLICKIVMQEITFMRNDASEKPEIYEYNMMIPSETSEYNENKIIEANYNKIRKILSLKKINLYGDQHVYS